MVPRTGLKDVLSDGNWLLHREMLSFKTFLGGTFSLSQKDLSTCPNAALTSERRGERISVAPKPLPPKLALAAESWANLAFEVFPP